ncbi:MAG: L-lactate permease, partial [Planctomycetota bacterium]
AVTSDGRIDAPALLHVIGAEVATLHTVTGILIPLILVTCMTYFFGRPRSVKAGLRTWRFALFAALAMTLPYLAVAHLLGPEFPSLVGGLLGLAVVIPAARRGWFLPADGVWDFPPRSEWPLEWIGTLHIEDDHDAPPPMPLWSAWAPYVLVALLLVATRLPELGLVTLLRSPAATLRWDGIFGTGISADAQPLYLPGTIFILASLATVPWHRLSWRRWLQAAGESTHTLARASVALVFTVPMVQVFINSEGMAGYPKMPLALAEGVAAAVGGLWPLVAPTIGGFGAFVAGSNTISNMMFSLFQFGVGLKTGYRPDWIVALQAVGGAAGNTICVHNVVAASAVAGLVGREGAVIRKTLPVFCYYALWPGIVGFFALHSLVR